MRRRALLALVAVACVVAAPPSDAAPRRSCGLVTDARGDVYAVRGYPTPLPDKTLDVVAGDLASDDLNLTAAVRVDDLVLPPETSPVGANYEVQFRISRSSRGFVLLASASPGAAPTYRLLVSGGDLPVESQDVTGVFDLARDEVRITVDLETLARWVLVQRGQRLTLDGAFSGRGVRGEGPFADEALEGPRTYYAAASSCVPVGR